MREFSLLQLAELLAVPAPVATLEDAGPHHAAFAETPRLGDKVQASAAAVVLVGEDFPELPGCRLWRVADPRRAFLRISEMFVERVGCDGIHPDACVHPDARLGEAVSLGPCAVIAAGARLGARCCIGPGAYVGEGARLGDDCLVEANASLMPGVLLGARVIVHANATIGADGFGFQWLGDHHHKVPQLGTVEVGDDVEIGSNACIDRATLGVTRIGRGSKIDNLVQVGHNCLLGEHVILVSQVGVAGSTIIGDGAVLGGKVGVAGHLTIGAGARVLARSGVTKDVPPGTQVAGFPAKPYKQEWRDQAAIEKLPDLLKQVKSLERELEAMRQRLARLEEGQGGGG